MNSNFYKNNRFNLFSFISDKKCLIVLSSGYEICKSEDENYEFQVDNNFYYLTGIKQPNVHLVILKDDDNQMDVLYIEKYDELYERWIGHKLSKNEASKLSNIYVSNIDDVDYFEEDLTEFLKEYKTIYLDLKTSNNPNHNSFALTLNEKIKKNYQDIEVKDIYNKIIELRTSKQPCEIKAIKSALKTTKKGIEALMKNCQAGLYEYQLEAYYDFAIKKDGNKPVSFKTIAAGGVNATTLHYSTNNSILHDQELVLFDLGCKDNGYCSDITRTFPINGKFSKLQKTIYNIVLKANKTIIKVAHAGMTLKELQEICIDVLATECLKAKLIKTKEEIKKYYFHSVSHSLGLDTHDPCLKNKPLPINSIITDEPGLYFPEYKIGIRIEDDLLLKEKKAINLSKDIIKDIKDIEFFMKKE